MTSKKIAHLSDIHIPVSGREEEYKQVFTNLFKSLTSDQPDLIVITGDIFHSKAHLSPEAVDLFDMLMRNLRDIAPVILIAGNHDAVLTAKRTRMDTLSPLVDMYNNGLPTNKQIQYLRDSGIYNDVLEGYQFAVMSLLDGGIPDFSLLKPDLKKVGLFHGVVTGAKYYTGVEAQTGKSEVDWNLFDMVMLGDIHLPQKIGDYNMYYAGSLLQRDFGEDPVNHGYILWEDGNPTFRRVQNKWGFYRCTYDGTWKIPEKISERGTVDISFPSTFTEREVRKEAEGKFPTQTLLFNAVKNVDDKEITINKEVVDLYSLDQQQQIFKDYFAEEKDAIVKQILDLNKEIYSEVKDNYPSVSRGKRWNIKSIEFDNLFAYSNDNTYNFDTKGGVYGLFSKNRAGKSSFLNTLPFALYGKLPSISRVDEVINSNASDYNVVLKSTVDGDEYTIVRSGKRTKSGSSNSVKLLKNGEGIGGTSRETDKMIEELFGSYDTFFRVFYISQKQTDTFLDLTPTERNNWMYQNLGADVFEYSHDYAKKKLKAIGAVIQEYKDVDFDVEINVINLDVATKENEIDEITTQIVEIESEVSGIQKKIDDFVIFDIDEQAEQIKYDSAVESKDRNTKELIVKKEELKSRMNLSEEKFFAEYLQENLKTYESSLETIKRIQKNIEELEERKSKGEKTSEEIEKQKILDTTIAEGNAVKEKLQATIREIDNFGEISDVEEIRNTLTQRKLIAVDLDSNNKEIESLRVKLDDLNETCNNVENVCDKCPFVQNKETLLARREELKDELRKCSEKTTKFKKELAELLPYTDEDLQEAILKTKELQSLAESKKDLEYKRAELLNKYNSLKNELVMLEEKRNSWYDLQIKDLQVEKSQAESVSESAKNLLREKRKEELSLFAQIISELEQKIENSDKIISEYDEIKKKIELNNINKEKKQNLIAIRESRNENLKNNLRPTLSKLEVELGTLLQQRDLLVKKKEELTEKKKEFDLYEKYVDATHKNKIPLFFLKNMISFIEAEVNKVISWMDNFRINLFVEGDNIISEITQDGTTWSTNLTSGMETFVINLAFRMAISNMGNISRPNFVFVDEGFGALDADNIQNIPNVFRYLQSQFDHVLVISHDDFMRDMVDRIIDIEKVDGVSKLI